MRDVGLNAPFGARCFLTSARTTFRRSRWPVLMYLLALALSDADQWAKVADQVLGVLMHLLALGAF